MSRIMLNPKNENHVIECGLDHTVGWFLQVLFVREENEMVIVDKDSLFTAPFGQSDLINLIREYAKDDELSKKVISSIAMDIDPAKGL